MTTKMKLVDLAMLMMLIGKYHKQYSAHYPVLCSGRCFIVLIIVVEVDECPHVEEKCVDSSFKTLNSVFVGPYHTFFKTAHKMRISILL